MKLCLVPDCHSKSYCKDYCNLHYRRWKKHGDTSVTLKNKNRKCSVENCNGEHASKGFCGTHYVRFKKFGDLSPRQIKKTCIIDGCDKFLHGHGYCRKHYWRFKNNGDPNIVKNILYKSVYSDQHELFLDKIKPNVETGCIEWQGVISNNGYGIICFNGSHQTVHRYSYEYSNGTIENNLCVCHHCDNKLCVRPDHLFLGSQFENMHDMIKKGRAVFPVGERNGNKKISETEAINIINLIKSGKRNLEIEKETNINSNIISQIRNQTTWKHLNYIKPERN